MGFPQEQTEESDYWRKLKL